MAFTVVALKPGGIYATHARCTTRCARTGAADPSSTCKEALTVGIETRSSRPKIAQRPAQGARGNADWSRLTTCFWPYRWPV